MNNKTCVACNALNFFVKTGESVKVKTKRREEQRKCYREGIIYFLRKGVITIEEIVRETNRLSRPIKENIRSNNEKHHINFNRKDNRKENLMYLCHKCHKLTLTCDFMEEIQLPITKTETIRVIKMLKGHCFGAFTPEWNKNIKNGLYQQKISCLRGGIT